MMQPVRLILSVLLTSAFLLAGCEWAGLLSAGADETSPAEDDILFLVQTPPSEGDAYMEALYQGAVVQDGRCLRLEGASEPVTVIWPHGYSLDERQGARYVLDGSGEEVGRIGGAFSLGGGIVSGFWERSPVPAAMQAAALEQCPGRYWFVNPY